MAGRYQDSDIDYASIIDQYKDLAFNIALKITQNKEDAEEIVQDSFLKAFRGFTDFKKKSSFSTWFYRIVYNTAISATRKKKQITYTIEDDKFIEETDPNQVNNVLKELQEKDRKTLVKEAMSHLNELDYTVLSLYYYDNLSLKEIAQIVRKKSNYLKVLLQRARSKLYSSLNQTMKKELKELL